MHLTIRPLTEPDLPTAGRIVSLAFGTFLGVPDPETFWADLDYVGGRWRADPTAAFAAEMDGAVIGSNFATRWGSVGFFGPLTVRPDLWDRGVARRLMDPVMERFAAWRVTQAGLFTFAHSAKHVGLYQRYGFWPRALTAVMSRPVERRPDRGQWSRYSEASPSEREESARGGRGLTGSLYPGLDVEREVRATHAQGLGDTVLLHEAGELVGLAVCHCGPGTEAGTGKCLVKFGAARGGAGAAERFERLLDACEALAAGRGLSRLEAGVNMARHEAYRAMLGRGFRTDIQGVAMHRDNEPGYNRPGVYLIDDWR